jgi:DNA-binding LacI/PurR family transcriptional regulator
MSARTDKHVTLATIAEAVGVSRMTVSNAYNRPDQLSPALRERILAAAQELGYSGPDPVARTLSRGETGSVGLVLDYALTVAFTDPATVQFLHGVAAGCEERERGLALVPRIAERDEALVRSALVDGFILYCVPETDPRLAAVRGRQLPYVRRASDGARPPALRRRAGLRGAWRFRRRGPGGGNPSRRRGAPRRLACRPGGGRHRVE